MIYKSIYKVPNGKLLKIKLECDDVKILSIQITGDFFSYPEEGIEIIEEELKGKKLDENVLLEKIQETISKNEIEFIGLDAKGLTTGIMMCLK